MHQYILSIFYCGTLATAAFPLIPQPTSVEPKNGAFALDGKWKIVAAGTSDFLTDQLSTGIKNLTGDVPSNSTLDLGTIKLLINPQADANFAYTLTVSPELVALDARDEAGVFYGIQTLLQLIQPGAKEIPACVIRDAPRFRWRGLMLDSSRHFQTVDEIKIFIDQMAHYKFNIFHWHLTDDQGWRIEIKSRPKLTEIGAWRVPREGIWWSRPAAQPGEKATHGGFYTQDQIRELVAYAQQRHITIVPEIDVPGHSLAILAAYPELSTTGGPFQVNPGSKFYGQIENTLDPSNQATFVFLEDVFREIATLFPGNLIHMGGDECPKNFWANDPDCQALMKQEGLQNPAELQSWFVKRVEKIIMSHGKKLLGWDEILEGGLAESATVMSWQGKEGGIAAAKMGRHVVMSPSPAYYLDLYQGHPEIEPATYGMARLKDTFLFDPALPADVDPKLLLGIQGNVWTEEIPTFRHAQYMTWPRAFAIAEEAWTQRSAEKDWPSFVRRVEAHFARFEAADWNYSRSIYDPAISLSSDKQSVILTPEIDGLKIHYTFDDTEPDATYPVYQEPLPIPKGASHLRTRSYRDGKPIGRLTLIALANIEKDKRTP